VGNRAIAESANGKPTLAAPAQTIHGMLRRQAAATPDAPALLSPGIPALTCAALLARTELLAAVLASAPPASVGAPVALLLPEGPACAATLLAVAAATVCAPLDPALPPPALAAALDRLRPTAVVAARGDAATARAVAARGAKLVEIDLADDPWGRLPSAVGGASAGATASDFAAAAIAGGEQSPDDIALLIATSGTTAAPRLAPLSHRNLLAAATASAAARELSAADRCLDLMRMFHISFFANTLSSLMAGGAVICPPPFDPDRVFAWLDELRPTWWIAPPPVLRHIATAAAAPAHRDILARQPLRFVRCASGALPNELRVDLERILGVPVVQGYGMTEAGPLIANESPARRRPGSVGPVTGPELEIRDDAGRPLPPGAVGEIVIRGPNVFAGYLNDPAANAAAFTADGWFRTGDLGELDADGFLFLRGRVREQINRGGLTISPLEVEAALVAHPAVASAVAFAVPDPVLGEDVAAAVTAAPGAALDIDGLRRFAAGRLAPDKTPRRILVVAELPRTATGKLRRSGLAEAFGLATPSPVASPTRPPSEPHPLAERVAAVWSDVLGLAVGVDDDFLALGGQSLAATRIVGRLQHELNVDLSLVVFFDAPTPAALAAALAATDPGLAADGGDRPSTVGGDR
jgi:acyl-CoA synthetase (AMP-forming)/AMP-acid ligase II